MRLIRLVLPMAAYAAFLTATSAAAQAAPGYKEAYAQIVMQMHMDMGAESTGDPDLDFVIGMIPHHAGAVAMAELLLEHGTDPELRAMAEAIIATQSTEIAFMEAWLAERGLGK